MQKYTIKVFVIASVICLVLGAVCLFGQGEKDIPTHSPKTDVHHTDMAPIETEIDAPREAKVEEAGDPDRGTKQAQQRRAPRDAKVDFGDPPRPTPTIAKPKLDLEPPDPLAQPPMNVEIKRVPSDP